MPLFLTRLLTAAATTILAGMRLGRKPGAFWSMAGQIDRLATSCAGTWDYGSVVGRSVRAAVVGRGRPSFLVFPPGRPSAVPPVRSRGHPGRVRPVRAPVDQAGPSALSRNRECLPINHRAIKMFCPSLGGLSGGRNRCRAESGRVTQGGCPPRSVGRAATGNAVNCLRPGTLGRVGRRAASAERADGGRRASDCPPQDSRAAANPFTGRPAARRARRSRPDGRAGRSPDRGPT